MGSFTIQGREFLLNGQPYRVLAGAMHYFRVHPDHWEDRLKKMRLMGLNTLETYVAWNAHEPRPGAFSFSGWLDIVSYIRQAAALGLYVIVRPGPYVCTEWDLGGLPAWLLKDPAVQLRCMNQSYLAAVDRYFDALLPLLAPLQISQGGPILAMQVENEYGSFGNDQAYLQYLERGMRDRGIDTLLFTSDGPTDEMLQSGTLPHIYKTVNFDEQSAQAFAKLQEYQPEAPLMCMEFWNGWFDHWGEQHHTRAADTVAHELDAILAAGASVNLYMFHGGTNFGFSNGANTTMEGIYQPTITSYDYDSPLDEAGDVTPKYMLFREVIGRYAPLPDDPIPGPAAKMALGPVELAESIGLFDALGSLTTPLERSMPEPMEMLDQQYGFVLYRTHVSGPRAEKKLYIEQLHDRAQVFVDGRPVGVLEREFPECTLSLAIPPGGATLDILVENMGRVNFGAYLLDRKGMAGVLLGRQFLHNWRIFSLPLENLAELRFAPVAASDLPTFYRGTFQVDHPLDTFLALPGWTKGVCWINGFNLGRYWKRGPQQTLYVPGPLLRSGKNEIIVFELHGTSDRKVEFHDRPQLG